MLKIINDKINLIPVDVKYSHLKYSNFNSSTLARVNRIFVNKISNKSAVINTFLMSNFKIYNNAAIKLTSRKN